MNLAAFAVATSAALGPWALAAAFAVLGAGVLLYQRRATSCPLHRRWIGYAAYLLAAACLIAAALLAAHAWHALAA